MTPRSRRSRSIRGGELVLAIVLVLAGCKGPPFGAANTVVAHADHAEAYRVHRDHSLAMVHDEGPVVVDDATLRELRGLLGDGGNFDPLEYKCDPPPAWEIVLHAGAREAHAFFSEGCDSTAVVLDGRPIAPWYSSQRISGRLRAIMARLFPAT